MIIRKSETSDLPRMLEIYEYARAFMAEHGNPNQWGPTGWPPKVEWRYIYFSLMAFLIVAGLFLSYGLFYDHLLDRERGQRPSVHDPAYIHHIRAQQHHGLARE